MWIHTHIHNITHGEIGREKCEEEKEMAMCVCVCVYVCVCVWGGGGGGGGGGIVIELPCFLAAEYWHLPVLGQMCAKIIDQWKCVVRGY